MTDKLDLAEEVAALRRTVAAQAVMLKEVMGAVDRPHDTLKELNLRLQVLENWQVGANTTLNEMNTSPTIDYLSDHDARQIWNEMNTSPTPLPRYPTYVPANDNAPPALVQKLKLLDEIDAVLKAHKRGIVGGDIWMALTDLEAVIAQHRRICHG